MKLLESTVGLGRLYRWCCRGDLDLGPSSGRRMTEPLPVVLVVDDTPETRRLMRRVLERDQSESWRPPPARRRWIGYVTVRPAAVVLDLRLPGVSGFDVARRVRAHDDRHVARTVLLACSASVQAEVIDAALAAGCDGFEGKPFEVSTFAARVRAAIARGHRA